MNKDLTSMIDKVASILEEKGLIKEAELLDVVSNTIGSSNREGSIFEEGVDPAVDILEDLISIPSNIKEINDLLEGYKKTWPRQYQEAMRRARDSQYKDVSPDVDNPSNDPDLSNRYGSYIVISEDILDYDLMNKEAGKRKQKRIKKWIPNLQKGGLHKDLGIPEGKDIPKDVLEKKYNAFKKKSEGDKKLSDSDSKIFHRLQFAINAKGFKH